MKYYLFYTFLKFSGVEIPNILKENQENISLDNENNSVKLSDKNDSSSKDLMYLHYINR